MLHELDTALRALVELELGDVGDVEVEFDAPTKDWASHRNLFSQPFLFCPSLSLWGKGQGMGGTTRHPPYPLKLSLPQLRSGEGASLQG